MPAAARIAPNQCWDALLDFQHNHRPHAARKAVPRQLTHIRLSTWIALLACLAAVHAQDAPKSTGATELQPSQSTSAEPVNLGADQMKKLFVKRVRPLYPALAQQARIIGKVRIRITVGADGNVKNIILVYGHPMLAPAAIEAAKKSKYRAYTVDGKPVDAEGPVDYDIY
jgi:TonB family protein